MGREQQKSSVEFGPKTWSEGARGTRGSRGTKEGESFRKKVGNEGRAVMRVATKLYRYDVCPKWGSRASLQMVEG